MNLIGAPYLPPGKPSSSTTSPSEPTTLPSSPPHPSISSTRTEPPRSPLSSLPSTSTSTTTTTSSSSSFNSNSNLNSNTTVRRKKTTTLKLSNLSSTHPLSNSTKISIPVPSSSSIPSSTFYSTSHLRPSIHSTSSHLPPPPPPLTSSSSSSTSNAPSTSSPILVTSGDISDLEDEDEKAPQEDHFILRVPSDVSWLSEFKDRVRKREPLDTQLIFQDPRQGRFQFSSYPKLPFQLVDLPTITEVQKTFDQKQFYKIGDLAQLILVHPPTLPSTSSTSSSPTTSSFFSFPLTTSWPDGLTPPLRRVRKRRFRARKVNTQAELIEQAVEHLLRADLMAEETSWTMIDPTHSTTTTTTIMTANPSSPKGTMPMELQNPIHQDGVSTLTSSSSSSSSSPLTSSHIHPPQSLTSILASTSTSSSSSTTTEVPSSVSLNLPSQSLSLNSTHLSTTLISLNTIPSMEDTVHESTSTSLSPPLHTSNHNKVKANSNKQSDDDEENDEEEVDRHWLESQLASTLESTRFHSELPPCSSSSSSSFSTPLVTMDVIKDSTPLSSSNINMHSSTESNPVTSSLIPSNEVQLKRTPSPTSVGLPTHLAESTLTTLTFHPSHPQEHPDVNKYFNGTEMEVDEDEGEIQHEVHKGLEKNGSHSIEVWMHERESLSTSKNEQDTYEEQEEDDSDEQDELEEDSTMNGSKRGDKLMFGEDDEEDDDDDEEVEDEDFDENDDEEVEDEGDDEEDSDEDNSDENDDDEDDEEDEDDSEDDEDDEEEEDEEDSDENDEEEDEEDDDDDDDDAEAENEEEEEEEKVPTSVSESHASSIPSSFLPPSSTTEPFVLDPLMQEIQVLQTRIEEIQVKVEMAKNIILKQRLQDGLDQLKEELALKQHQWSLKNPTS